MRLTRLIIGGVIILVTLWILLGEQLAGASADAVVNAQLSTIRAPLGGKVSLGARSLGARVQVGEEIGTVTDPLVDRVRLEDLEMERDLAQAELTRAESLILAAEAGIAPLEARTETFRSERLAETEDRLGHARARLSLLEDASPVEVPGTDPGSQSAADRDVEPAGLPNEGQSGDDLEARSADQGPFIALEYARERVDSLETEMRAMQAGVFLGDGYNDAPWSEQRADELRALVRDRRAARTEASSRLDAVEVRLASARLAVSPQIRASLASTVNGEVWEIRANDGEQIERGQDVMVLLDCEALIVTLSVTESIYNSLAVGDEARFRLSNDGRDFAASVARLGGSGALTIYRNLAIAPSQKHLERYDVTLLVPDLATAGGLSCPVGRTGRAFFERRPLDWLRGI